MHLYSCALHRTTNGNHWWHPFIHHGNAQRPFVMWHITPCTLGHTLYSDDHWPLKLPWP
jgi:hypothetical protein